MRFARQFLVSAAVLTSSSMLAEEVFAEGAEIIPFECDLPLFGTARCGDPNRNIRIGGLRRVSVALEAKAEQKCALFYVYHAVNEKVLATEMKACTGSMAKHLWTNSDEEVVDVVIRAKAENSSDSYSIRGNYIIDRP
jgi:hypothetical protein